MRQNLFLTAALALLLAPLPSSAVRAQTRDPARFRDSLQAVTDVSTLVRMEHALDMPSVARSLEPILDRGLIVSRIFLLTGDPTDATRSRAAFRQAIERFPDSAWAHYGYALSLSEGPGTRLGGVLNGLALSESVAELLGKDPQSRARSEVRKLLAKDPSFSDAAVLLADLALAGGGTDKALLDEARDVLVQTRKSGGNANSAALASALARVETRLGNYANASAIAADAAATGDALALKTQAEALFMQPGHEEEGGRAYDRAIASLTPSAAASMYADVQVLLNANEAAEWKRAKADQQADWLKRFWQRRAAESGVSVAQRMATHYRRLAIAKQKYVRNSMRGSAGSGVLLTELPPGTYPFDQRGVMFVRHGEPGVVVSSHTRGLLPNETWIYDIPDSGPQWFHFVALRASADFSLVSDLTKAIDPIANTEDRNRALLTLLQDRSPYETTYQNAAARIRSMFEQNPTLALESADIRSVLESGSADYRTKARETLRTDSYRKSYEKEIHYVSDVFAFRTPFARTEVTAAFAIPAKDLEPMAGSDGKRYAVKLSLIVIDTLQSRVTRSDTTIEVQSDRALKPDEYVRAHITMPVVPSEFAKYRLVAEDVVSGNGATTADDKKVKDFGSSDRLLLSDIVLALPDSLGDWTRGAQHLALALPRTFDASHPFTVFYEIYNLAKDESYTTHIKVTRTKGGSQPIELSFDGVASLDANGFQQEVRQVATTLVPGTYRITVQVTANVTHRTATTETEFTVTK